MKVVDGGTLFKSVYLPSPPPRSRCQKSGVTDSHPNTCFVLGSHGAEWDNIP